MRKTKTKALNFLLVLVMVLGLLPGTAWAAGGTLEGEGTPESPYLIADEADLIAFRDKVNAEASSIKCAKLTADIELSGDWTPFNPSSGYVTEAYAGTFDGDGHTISGLNINAVATNQGLFGVINGATIKNLKVVGSVRSSKACVGGIIGKVQQGKIENCSFSGTVTTDATGSSAYAGGIAGYAGNSATETAEISGCVNTSSVIGGVSGGIAGYAKYTTITNCYNTGSINGGFRSGGIAGQLQINCTATNCYNRGTISGSTTASDIVDFLYSTSKLTNCYYKDKASGTGTGTVENSCQMITDADALLENLGTPFSADTNNINNNWPILSWQAGVAPAPKDPKITISGSTLLYMTNSDPQPTTTLTVRYIDMAAVPVTWSIKSGEDVIALNDPQNVDGNRSTQSVSILRPGRAVVTATAGGYTAEQEITVWPFVTTVEIEGTVAVGQTVKAKINVLGGGELDYETFPINVQWKYKDDAADISFKDIPGAAGREFIIPEDYNGKYLSFTYEDKSPSRPSQVRPAGAAEPDPQPPVADKTLEEALKWYTMRPVFGQDANANRVMERYLAERGLEGFTASVKSVQEVCGGADIAENGDITYFYADPNTAPSVKMGSFKVTFILARGGEALEKEVPVILYWDADKVRETMTREILDKVTLDTSVPVTGDLSLPKVVDGKEWTLISWQSSDGNAISVSGKNQTTADTLFDPYVGVVKPGNESKTVTLTAAFTFRLTNDTTGGEAPVVLYKTFTVTVPPLDGNQAETIRAGLLARLNTGFDAKGLADAAAGERLTPDSDGVYTVSGDIQLPTTRDFGVDGKYYPVTITTDNAEALRAPNVNNAARVEVYRPVGTDAEGTITVTLHDRDTNVTASREFKIRIAALTREEIDRELALMEKVKASYFDGIRGGNVSKDDVRTDLTPFFEVYERDGELVWVHSVSEKTGRGIVPVPIEGWEDLELWRLFKSSNPNVISHENLIVTRQTQAKAVTITSRLSSQTLGRYGALYWSDPSRYAQYADLAPLYYQEVTTDASAQPAVRRARAAAPAVRAQADTIVVRGTADPESAVPVSETIDVTFSLTGLDGETWISAVSLKGLDESSTVYDVFTRMLTQNGCTAVRQKGTYIVSVSGPKGTLSEKAYGEKSGWMYRVNGKIPEVYMGACPLHNGDSIQVFYTRDAGRDDPNWSWPSTGPSASGGGSANSNTRPASTAQIKEDKKTGTYTITLEPKGGAPQIVTIPNVKEGQIAVIVRPDGREEPVKKSVLADGKLKLQLQDSATIKLVDCSSHFSDVNRGSWYSSAVNFVSGRGLFAGVGGGRFAPGLPLSRGMLATILCRLEEPEPRAVQNLFADVADTAWYAQGIAWAKSTGIVSGYGDGRFGPNDNITREQLAVMLFRYANTLNMSTGGRDSLSGFSDSGTVSDWAKDAVAWAVDSGIISGLPDGTLAPSGTASRAEAAAMLQRFIAFLLK